MTVDIGQSKIEELAVCPICHFKTVVADYYLEEQGSYTIRCHCDNCGEDFGRNYFTLDEGVEVMRLYGRDEFYRGPTRVAEDDFLRDLKYLSEMDKTSTPVTIGMFLKVP